MAGFIEGSVLVSISMAGYIEGSVLVSVSSAGNIEGVFWFLSQWLAILRGVC